MSKDRVIDSLGRIDDDMAQEVESLRQKKKKSRPAWVKWNAIAACICLVFVGTVVWRMSTPSNPESSGITISESGVTIPPMDVSLSANPLADMIGFFIYQGRCYVHYEWIYDDVDIVGEHLGMATGLIDEWTPRDGYVEFAGSVRGDFYSVKGYDPSFMLCMKDASGAVSIYISNTGITLKYGSELYEDRLYLSGNYDSVQYESRVSWYQSLGDRYDLGNADDTIQEFIEQLCVAEFIPCTSVPLGEGQSSIIDMEIYHLYFMMNNGMTIHLRLYENGYVRFQGLLDLCVQIPAENYGTLLTLLDERTGTAVDSVPNSMGTTLEDCISNPELGAYVPAYVPEDMTLDNAEVLYYLDSETGDETGTKEIYLYYVGQTNHAKSYTITITWANEYGKNGWAGPMVDASDLNMETVAEHMKTETSSGAPLSYGSKIDVGVWHDDVSVVISARGVDTEAVLSIMDSIG